MVLGLCLALMVTPHDQPRQIPLYLYSLVFLILGHFFAAHGNSIAGPGTGTRSPLYLPRGTLRTLIVVAFLGGLGWLAYTKGDLTELQPDLQQPWVPAIILGAFFLGILINRIAEVVLRGPTGLPYWYQDIVAWFALIAVLGLGAEMIIQFFINPTLPKPLELPSWQGILSAVVAFYFGVRS
jgi:hypothetical protein